MSLLAPDYGPLQAALQERFEESGWVSIAEIEEFVRSDATIYYAGQVRSQAMKPMEQQGRIEVVRKPGTKRFDYPEGRCRISFRPQILSLF